MTTKLSIYGAGMAGLLAAHMLRRQSPVVYEAQSALPDNHGALLRFRSDAVARATGIPLRRVRVYKGVYSSADGRVRDRATLRDANEYALKVSGMLSPRSVLSLEPVDRYVAPDDFLAALARGVAIEYGEPLTAEWLSVRDGVEDARPAVSTVPLPVIARLSGLPAPAVRWQPIWAVNVTLAEPAIDVYQTLYYPRDVDPYYRASLTGPRLTIEYMREPRDPVQDSHDVLRHFGLGGYGRLRFATAPTVKRQEYGKLLPCADDLARRAFIMALTDRFGLYSVGRFATWRQLLLDDVVQDVGVVDGMIAGRDAYARRRHYA